MREPAFASIYHAPARGRQDPRYFKPEAGTTFVSLALGAGY